MGAYKRAMVGEWKPGRKRRSCMFRRLAETSRKERMKEGKYGTSLSEQVSGNPGGNVQLEEKPFSPREALLQTVQLRLFL